MFTCTMVQCTMVHVNMFFISATLLFTDERFRISRILKLYVVITIFNHVKIQDFSIDVIIALNYNVWNMTFHIFNTICVLARSSLLYGKTPLQRKEVNSRKKNRIILRFWHLEGHIFLLVVQRLFSESGSFGRSPTASLCNKTHVYYCCQGEIFVNKKNE